MNFLFLLKNWKLIVGGLTAIGLFITLALLSNKKSKLEDQVNNQQIEIKRLEGHVLRLQRDSIDIRREADGYLQTIRNIKADFDKLKQADKAKGKGMSSQIPSLDQIKNLK
jgi:hypothetical protein